ncbi:MAG TPA: hypothetical protein VK986_23435 [Tepidisphaeraceae bacterium]|nr:hypothetical protein [Tepidisphaeraceae bacterium]
MRIRRRWMSLAVLGALGVVAGCDDQGDPVTTTPASVPSLPELPKGPGSIPVVTPSSAYKKVDPKSFDVKGPLVQDRFLAKIVQTVDGLNHPLGVAVSRDGKFLYVTNTAHTGAGGMLEGGGSVGKYAIGDDGRLTAVNAALARGLTAPMGIGVLPKATKTFPAGTLFVSTGTTYACDAAGELIVDEKRLKPGVTMIDPDTGATLGFIPMGSKTPVARSLTGGDRSRPGGQPVYGPAGLTFGADGDLFVCDVGQPGEHVEGKSPSWLPRPGVLRVRHRELDAAAAGGAELNVAFVSVRFVPVAIHFTPLDGGNLFWACAGQGAGGGAVWRTTPDTFGQSNTVRNVIGDLGPLTGVGITSRGTCFMSRADGDLVLINRQKIDQLRFAYEDQPVFATPGAFVFHVLPTGETVCYLPEQEPGPIDAKQRLRVILMPSSL